MVKWLVSGSTGLLASHPGGSTNIPSRFMRMKAKISTSLVGHLALRRLYLSYRRGHGFESLSGLNFFSGFNFTTA